MSDPNGISADAYQALIDLYNESKAASGGLMPTDLMIEINHVLIRAIRKRIDDTDEYRYYLNSTVATTKRQAISV
jgi:hypothetical protein